MYKLSNRAGSSVVADNSFNPSTYTVPVPDRESDRLADRPVAEGVEKFGARLENNGQWMKQFLHGGRKAP